MRGVQCECLVRLVAGGTRPPIRPELLKECIRFVDISSRVVGGHISSWIAEGLQISNLCNRGEDSQSQAQRNKRNQTSQPHPFHGMHLYPLGVGLRRGSQPEYRRGYPCRSVV